MQLTATLGRNAIERKPLPTTVYLFYFAAGMAPISALALSVFGLWTLPVGTLIFVLPGLLGCAILGLLYPACGRVAGKGFIYGLIAVTVYDCTRLPFIVTGLWGDFIPKIGGWLLSQPEPNWVVGYLWRYLGNGGGMGMAFTVLYVGWLQQWRNQRPSRLRQSVQKRRQRQARPAPSLTAQPFTLTAALAFGILVWGCLLLTLLLSPHGEAMLFQLTPFSFGLSLLGHVVFGAVLGKQVQHLPLDEMLVGNATSD